MSTSVAPSCTQRRASRALISVSTAPSGKADDRADRDLAASCSSWLQNGTKRGLTQTAAKWCWTASRQSCSTIARVASGLSSVWSMQRARSVGVRLTAGSTSARRAPSPA
jgi:hypothetical protein